jgi:hypothetical protein
MPVTMRAVHGLGRSGKGESGEKAINAVETRVISSGVSMAFSAASLVSAVLAIPPTGISIVVRDRTARSSQKKRC